MARSWWFGAAVLAAVLGAGAPAAAVAPRPATHGPIYYLDCGAQGPGDGSQSSPWTSLAQVDATVFTPGSSLLIARGTTCAGTLAPGGSGTVAAPITISAHGTGPLPVIDGGSHQEAALLDNQQHWKITDLATTGGDR